MSVDVAAPQRGLSPLSTFLVSVGAVLVLSVLQFALYAALMRLGPWFWLFLFFLPTIVGFGMALAGANRFTLPLGFACGALPGSLAVAWLAFLTAKAPAVSSGIASMYFLNVGFGAAILYALLAWVGVELARLLVWVRGRR